MHPDSSDLRLDLLANIYFASLLNTENKHEHVIVMIQIGVMLNFRRVPIFQSFKIQLEIELSTLETEHIALS